MVALVIAFPRMVTSSLEKSTVDPSKIQIEIPPQEGEQPQPPDFGTPGGEQKPGEPPADDLQKQFGGK